MVILYVFIGITIFIVGIYLLILTIIFLIEGTKYFKLASKKLKLELGIIDEKITENSLENKITENN